jgi:hypothetical protein
MATRTHRIKDQREVITYGGSEGFTISRDQLDNAGIPVGTEVVVKHLDDEPGLKLQPPQPDEIYHRDKLRKIIEMGNSQGVTIKHDDLLEADIPVGTDIEVKDLKGGPGIKAVPDPA